MSRGVHGSNKVFGRKRVYLTTSDWIIVYNGVYEPAEDTWLLLEIIDRDRVYGKTVLDMCSGTGVIGVYLLKYMGVERVLFTDIDWVAVLNIAENSSLHRLGYRVAILNTSTGLCVRDKIVDVVVANPPYLPGNRYVDLEGGSTGLEVVGEVIRCSSRVLVDNGVLYLVFSSLTSAEKVYELLATHGFGINRRLSRHYFFEDIIAVEAVKES